LADRFDFKTPRSIVEDYILKNDYLANIGLNNIWKQRQIEEGNHAANGKI
jgi:hypothetical protein